MEKKDQSTATTRAQELKMNGKEEEAMGQKNKWNGSGGNRQQTAWMRISGERAGETMLRKKEIWKPGPGKGTDL